MCFLFSFILDRGPFFRLINATPTKANAVPIINVMAVVFVLAHAAARGQG